MKAQITTLILLTGSLSCTQAVGSSDLDVSLFSMSAPDMLALNLAVTEVPLDTDAMLRRARDAPSDPWERQEAKSAFIADLQQQINHFSHLLDRQQRGSGRNFRVIENLPVQLKSVHVESRTFSIDLPFIATAPPFQEGAPLNVAAAPAVGFVWQWTFDEGGRVGGDFCDDRFRQGVERIPEPRELGPTIMRFAPNLSGHPPTGLSTPPYRMRACSQLTVDTNETARDLFRHAQENAFFLNADCRMLVPSNLNVRGYFEGLTSACFLGLVTLSPTPNPELSQVIAIWDPATGQWDYQPEAPMAFLGMPIFSLNEVTELFAGMTFTGEVVQAGQASSLVVTALNEEMRVEYADLGCSGSWKLVHAAESILTFRETIHDGADICGDTAYVNFDVQPESEDHHIGLEWMRSENGPAFATGVLNRQ